MNEGFRGVCLAAVITLLAPIAQAEEEGEIILTISGEEHHFSLDPRQSDWDGSGDYASVNIYARPTDQATRDLYGSFSLGFEAWGGTVGAPEMLLNRKAGETRETLFGSQEKGGFSVEVDAMSVEGAFLTMSGSFTAEMGTTENYGGSVDLSNPVPVSGSFAVTLE